MKVVVTGGAGFIGSNVVDALLSAGHSVRALDNFSTGRIEFLARCVSERGFQLFRGDLLNTEVVDEACRGADAVIHLAANADVRFGWDHPRRDIEQNVLTTQVLLESMRQHHVERLIFASTGSVYGNSIVIPTPEDAPFPAQTSLYGASKVAAEALISAYAEAGYISATVFRFVSILGPRYTHGHVIDFVAQLQRNRAILKVLGNGEQRKSYLHVKDCVAGILLRLQSPEHFEVLNLGHDDYCSVKDSIGWITGVLGAHPQIYFGKGSQGWVGDNPFIHLDNQRMKGLGWSPSKSIQSAIEDTVHWLLQNQWVMERAVFNR